MHLPAIAVHEAGHAVVAVALELTVRVVGLVVSDDGTTGGVCVIDATRGPVGPRRPWCRAAIAWAGVAAEAIAAGTSIRPLPPTDRPQFDECARMCCRSPAEVIRFEALTRSKAFEVLDDRWQAVVRVAAALCSRSLDGDDLARVMAGDAGAMVVLPSRTAS